MKSLIAVLMCMAALALPWQVQPQSRPQSDADDIREAVFRHMFQKNASSLRQSAAVYCLSIAGGDPGDAFMSRFGKHQPPVKKASECVVSEAHGVLDKATSARGLIFRVVKIEQTGDAKATVEGGYYEGNMSASGNIYTLEKMNGVWRVVGDVMLWIS